ncbi:MAG TPA: (d)CMP kinase [Candidatus Limosilactobacillus merdipullorum]|uniref:Cytidylate kinase n=1 Tax=Candidatus Limosilactobacillus merdipullorum TaxID=2838653 RepID=A0A9D1QR11_9LACO|nr:(d)CMP kinase [Candidatus Limosilactobacillus merdipullorum]
MKKDIQVAIDGPASSGKSTVAKIIAKKLGLIYCDTGAMYRSVTWAVLNRQIDLADTAAVARLARTIKISFQPGDPDQRVFVDAVEVTKPIREGAVSSHVSAVAAIPTVREAMTMQQRQIADQGGIVMDGRDIGTTVLPNADVKIFLVASAHERALRRYKENQIKGLDSKPLAEIEAAIKLRDQKDSTRKVSPLKKAADAVELDTTSLSIDQVVDRILNIIEKSR